MAPYNIEKGCPQGNVLSPAIFLLAVQPLLMVLDFDLRIVGVPDEESENLRSRMRSHIAEGSTSGEDWEVIMEAWEGDWFADDTSFVSGPDERNLKTILETADSFFHLSGLKLNRSKSIVVKLGNWNPSNEVANLELEFAERARLLGYYIDRNGLDVQKGWETATEKIQKQINHWNRFRLTLKGRIQVASTFLTSNLSYPAMLSPPSSETAENLSRLIDGFISGKDRLAKKLITMPFSERGLARLSLPHFCQGLCLSLWKQAFQQMFAVLSI